MIGHGGRLTVPARLTAVPTPRRAIISRAQAITRLTAIVESANLVLLYLPNGTDTTTSTESSANGATITWDADISGRFTRLGNAFMQSFNGTNQYGTVADHARYSFGNGTDDSPFSLAAFANVTDTAALRVLATKYTGSDREWMLYVSADDQLGLLLYDQSAGAAAYKPSDAAFPQGVSHLLGATYDGRGGVAALDGVTLYANALSLAATANYGGTYDSMENLAAPLAIGAESGLSAQHFAGSLGLILLASVALTATQHAQIAQVCRDLFGVSL